MYKEIINLSNLLLYSRDNLFNIDTSKDFMFYLDNKKIIKSYRNVLKNKSGIYIIINKINSKQYIGCAKDLYKRLLEHLLGEKSNKLLQIAIKKSGLNNFTFNVLEYLEFKTLKELTDLEAKYIGKFDVKNLYNSKKLITSTNMLNYKSTVKVNKLDVGIYDLNFNLVKNFKNNVELAKYLNISSTTVGKYIKTGKIFKFLYYFKKNIK